MVEFQYDEAKKLLNTNLENAVSNLKSFVRCDGISIFRTTT